MQPDQIVEEKRTRAFAPQAAIELDPALLGRLGGKAAALLENSRAELRVPAIRRKAASSIPPSLASKAARRSGSSISNMTVATSSSPLGTRGL